MKVSQLISLAVLPACIVASPIHNHHVHKRDVKVVTDIVTVYVDSNNNLYTPGLATTSSTSSTSSTFSTSSTSTFSFDLWPTSPTTPTTSTVATTSSSVEVPIVETSSSSSTSTSSTWTSNPTTLVSSVISSTSSATFSSSSTASSTSSTSSSTSTLSGAAAYAAEGKGISYSPYTTSGQCKTSAEVATDFESLQDFGIIRLYDVDCSGISNVLAAKSSSQKLFLGIYNIDSLSDSIATMKSAVEASSNGWNDVYTVSIGNELVNSGSATVSQVSAAVSSARALLTEAGYTGPVVSVDTLVAVQNNPDLCEYSDYIAVNSHPFWDGSVYPENSGSWLLEQIENIYTKCGSSKSVMITETGWPTKGDNYGVSVPSESNQLAAIQSIADTCGSSVLFFTPYNDYWKSAGSYGVEQYWGVLGEPLS